MVGGSCSDVDDARLIAAREAPELSSCVPSLLAPYRPVIEHIESPGERAGHTPLLTAALLREKSSASWKW